MKAEEAIEILKTWRITGDKTHEALDMAIDALQELKNSSQELKNSSDLIRRRDAIDAVEFGITYAKVFNKYTGGVTDLFKKSNEELQKAVDRIEALPSAQPEPSQVARDIATIIENEKDMRVVLQNSAQPEIIRCKDCKYYKAYEYTGELACHYVIGGTVIRKLDDFCSRAERITDGRD